jgi:hypothetical protein
MCSETEKINKRSVVKLNHQQPAAAYSYYNQQRLQLQHNLVQQQ